MISDFLISRLTPIAAGVYEDLQILKSHNRGMFR